MDPLTITVQDCIDMNEKDGATFDINDGKVIGYYTAWHDACTQMEIG